MKKIYTFLIVIVISGNLNAQSLYFPPLTGNQWDTISLPSLNWCQSKIDSLYAYLDTNNTKAFILLKDGKIVLEKYFGSHTQSSAWYWASAGKTITSFMTGIAQQEHYLSITDTTSVYLGQGWTNCTPAQEEKISIRHQLTMSSGLNDEVPDNHCTLDTCLDYKADAGTRWAYHNAPYTLLDKVIESATSMTLNQYTTQKLKSPTGMTGTFIPLDYNNVFFSDARSMARFGLLILNKGNWNGTQIMTDTTYFNQMLNTSQSYNESYGYLWWLNGKPTYMLPGTQFVFNGSLNPNAPSDMFLAAGLNGQFLNIVPEQNLVWLRMGESPEGLSLPFSMNDKIWEYINDFECTVSSLNEQIFNTDLVQIFPNPGMDILNIKSENNISKVEFFNVQGKIIKTVSTNSKELNIPINDLPIGLYFIKINLANGKWLTEKMIKE